MIENDAVVTADETFEKMVDAIAKLTVTILAMSRHSKDGAKSGRVTKQSGVNKMVDFFTLFGITIAVLFVDAVVCSIQVIISDTKEDDDDWWLCPLITNTIGFAISLAFHVFNHIR